MAIDGEDKPNFPNQLLTGRLSRTREFMRRWRRSLLPIHEPSILPSIDAEKTFLVDLIDSVATGRYFPTPPRGHLVTRKTNGVPRFVPCLRLEDAALYFCCVDSMQRIIGLGRSANTFGGWSMGNAQRKAENLQTASLDKVFGEVSSPYSLSNSMDPRLLRRIWRDFQTRAYQFSRNDSLTCFAMIDVANFFDTIDLLRLERSLRSIVGVPHFQTLELLMLFLHHWNRDLEGYSRRTIGLPLDEIGDCSRILSNLYLQSYDRSMVSFCELRTGKRNYLRYADDQILMSDDMNDLLLMVRYAAEQMHRIGLTINAEKVRIFDDRSQYDSYWCFEFFFELLADPMECARSYFTLRDRGELQDGTRHSSVLRALTWRLQMLDPDYRSRVIDALLQDGLASVDPTSLHIFTQYFSPDQREAFLVAAEHKLKDIRFNHLPLALCRFFSNATDLATPRFVEHYLSERIYEFKWSK